jgi:hypothetical protein
MHTVILVLLYVAATLIIGVAAGVVWALSTYSRVRTIGLLNKTGGGKSFVIITGSPEAVKQAFDVTVAVIGRVQANQQAKDMKVGIANDTPAEPTQRGETGQPGETEAGQEPQEQV